MPRKVIPITQLADIVQIRPEHDDAFGGCLAVVTDVHEWGISAYVVIPGEGDKGGLAYLRVPNGHYVRTGGTAPYVTGSEFSEGNQLSSGVIANDIMSAYEDEQ